jgi:hypothetical protein
MIRKMEISRGQFVALLAALILVSLIAVWWSGFVQSGEIVLMIIVVTAYVGIIPFLLGVVTQAIFRRKSIPLFTAWTLAFILVAVEMAFYRKTAITVLEQDILCIGISLIIIGVFINAGIKSCRAFIDGRKIQDK